MNRFNIIVAVRIKHKQYLTLRLSFTNDKIPTFPTDIKEKTMLHYTKELNIKINIQKWRQRIPIRSVNNVNF